MTPFKGPQRGRSSHSAHSEPRKGSNFKRDSNDTHAKRESFSRSTESRAYGKPKSPYQGGGSFGRAKPTFKSGPSAPYAKPKSTYEGSKPRSSSYEGTKSYGVKTAPSYSPARSGGYGEKSYSKPAFSSSYRGSAPKSFGGPRKSFGGRVQGGAGASRGGRSGSGGKRGFRGDFIDEKRFINKAQTAAEDTYVTKHTFADFGLHEKLAKNLADKGYVKPSPIQDQAIQIARTGRDIIGIAATGTGKTGAFLIPLINKLVDDRNHKVMILAPTRELAQQIEAELQSYTKNMNIFSVSCVGGAPINRQIRELQKGVHMVIGTPGRVKDLIKQKKIHMQDFGSVVLDEADRMLDMGFVEDMRYILGLMPKNRQSLFFSATFSSEIKRLCGDFLNNPETVEVKSRDTAATVEQNIIRAKTKEEKIEALHDILIQPNAKKVLIFREMKRHTDDLANELKKRGFKALALHGDMRNRERERAVASLATGAVQVVIATDVAARGIDIKDISHVINYDVPNTYDTYIHRIGRTGRAGQGGIALTFV